MRLQIGFFRLKCIILSMVIIMAGRLVVEFPGIILHVKKFNKCKVTANRRTPKSGMLYTEANIGDFKFSYLQR